MLLLSLVTPVLNDDRHLRQLLYHLRSFVSDHRWELIVVDDASDSSMNDPVSDAISWGMRVHHLRLGQRSGPGAARNAGLAVASAEFVSFIDVDDHVFLETLLDVAQAASRRNLQAVSCRYSLATKDMTDTDPQPSPTELEFTQEYWPERLKEPPAIWSWIFRRCLLDSAHIEFPALTYAEDLVFLLRVSRTLPTFNRTAALTYSHFVRESTAQDPSASSIAVAEPKFVEALQQLEKELTRCPDWQASAILHWKLRISSRFLFTDSAVRAMTRASAARALARDVIAHPRLAFEVFLTARDRVRISGGTQQ